MENRGEFEQMRSLMIEDTIPFYVYKSVTTGITICFAETEGPLVSGYFNINHVSTVFDDILPRVLEHLIPMGSEKYPYKGTFEKWHERCRATFRSSGSHYYTYYRTKTRSTEDFLYLLPVYLDHIFYPTLTESAFLTEIHHINGKGKDAGIFYRTQKFLGSRLQFILTRDTKRVIHKDNNIVLFQLLNDDDLRYLRKYNNEIIRQYHEKFYKPENLTILITGQVKHDTIFQALMPLEQKLRSRMYNEVYDQTPYIFRLERKDTELGVIYPCISTNLVVSFIWQEPSLVNQIYEKIGCFILWSYIQQESSITKTFTKSNVVIEARKVCACGDFLTSSFCLRFFGRETQLISQHHMSRINEQLKLIMKWSLMKVLHKFHKKGVNMKTIKTKIHRVNSKVLSALKNRESHCYFALIVFNYIRFGKKTDVLDEMCNFLHNLKKLENEPQSFWINLFEEYFVNQPMITFTKMLKREEYINYMQSDKDRIQKRIVKLGPNGLKQKEMKLQEAIKENERPIPDEVLANMPRTD